MCYEIGTETLLLNFFVKSKKKSLSFTELERIIDDVKNKLNYSVIVDTNDDVLREIASMHNSIFRLKPTYVELTNGECERIKDEIRALQEAYDEILPEYVKTTYNTVFSKYEKCKNKAFLDSVHGYIYIASDYCKDIIDTPIFQRLRRIEQTSYRALYPSARHDRFIHSIGVYHIGNRIFQGLKNNLKCFDPEPHGKIDSTFKKDGFDSGWDFLRQTFEIACLLHDCGHAPFSHTFEKYYVREKSTIVNEIIEQINLYRNKDSITHRGYSNEKISILEYEITSKLSPSEHELASAWLLVHEKGFRKVFEDRQLDPILAIRMIIGCKHLQKSDYESETQFKVSIPERIEEKHQIENCFISLLNGHVIDADRLDYFARDRWATGLNTSTVNIDRLLSSLSIKKEKTTGQYVVCLDKRALTELKNIVDVKEFQTYWLINHHKIHYDNKVLEKAVTKLASVICGQSTTEDSEQEKDAHENESMYKLFNYKSFIQPTVFEFEYQGKSYIEYLYLTSDDDIVYLLKKFFLSQEDKNVNYAKEWLHRDCQMIPLWKSYAEFMDIFKDFALDVTSTPKLHSSVTASVTSFLKDLKENERTLHFEFTKPLIEQKKASPFLVDNDKSPLYISIGDEVIRYSDVPYLTGASSKSSKSTQCTNRCKHKSKVCVQVTENQDKSRYWSYFYLFLPKIYDNNGEIEKKKYNKLKEKLKEQIIKDYKNYMKQT
jgi:HD superfamily phosphohydrolase